MTNYPEKLRVTRNWPCGPGIGTLFTYVGNAKYQILPPSYTWYSYESLKDFTEPVEEKGYYFRSNGEVDDCNLLVDEFPAMTFKSRESAEAFRDWMKKTHEEGFDMVYMDLDKNVELVKILRERVPAK